MGGHGQEQLRVNNFYNFLLNIFSAITLMKYESPFKISPYQDTCEWEGIWYHSLNQHILNELNKLFIEP